VPLLKDLRLAGLRALHGAGPVRRALMRTGLGADQSRSSAASSRDTAPSTS
jgi:hypothetical protein